MNVTMARTGRGLFGITAFMITLVWPVHAGEPSGSEIQIAAAFQLPQLPGIPGPVADWRQWDSFFTFVVKQFGQEVPGDLKEPLGDAFLDSRYELTNAIAPGKGGNPVPDLFLNGWKRLSPIMNKALPGLPKQTASQYANFISAADKLAAFGGAGSQLGLVQLSPDALRGMARILEPSSAADPLAFSTSVDSGLRSLLGFGSPITVPEVTPCGNANEAASCSRRSKLPLCHRDCCTSTARGRCDSFAIEPASTCG
jgi:hypothetical protein